MYGPHPWHHCDPTIDGPLSFFAFALFDVQPTFSSRPKDDFVHQDCQDDNRSNSFLDDACTRETGPAQPLPGLRIEVPQQNEDDDGSL